MSLNPGQADALNALMRYIAGAGMVGAAGRMGLELARQTSPRYSAPQIADPVMVTIPRPVAGPVPPSLPPRQVKELPAAKTAGLEELMSHLPYGQQLWNAIPESTSVFGDKATNFREVPALYAAAPLGMAAGGGAGFYAADKLLRAADQRRARRDLDEAQREFQDAAIGRAKSIHFPDKVAADMSALLDDQTPRDPVVARIKAALDRAYAAGQITSSVTGLPPAVAATPLPAPAKPPALGAMAGGQLGGATQPPPVASTSMPPPPAPMKTASDYDYLNVLKSWLWPGLAGVGTAPAMLNMGLAGTGAGVGALLGYQHARDKNKADEVRQHIKAIDQANASQIPPPMIARIVPTSAPAG